MRYATDRAVIATPVGAIAVEGDDRFVSRISIMAEAAPIAVPTTAAVKRAVDQLERWFSSEINDFDLDLTPPTTERGLTLRNGLIAVGYGETLSYGALARMLKSSPRAIGQLCARNPFPIVVPCHRVLAGNGLGHYSAGRGAETKQWLLDHERRIRR